MVLENKNWAQSRNFVAKLPYFSYTSQISLHHATYMVKIIVTYSITQFSIEIWTNFVKFNLNEI